MNSGSCSELVQVGARTGAHTAAAEAEARTAGASTAGASTAEAEPAGADTVVAPVASQELK